jgi:hypothetical protein
VGIAAALVASSLLSALCLVRGRELHAMRGGCLRPCLYRCLRAARGFKSDAGLHWEDELGKRR